MALQVTWFEERNPANTGTRLLQGYGPFRVGRALESDIELSHQHISREHLLISVDGPTITVTDKSQNGSFLEGRRIDSAVWTPGEILRLGPFSLEVQVVADAPKRPARPPAEPQTEGPGQASPSWDAPPAAHFDHGDHRADAHGHGGFAPPPHQPAADWVDPPRNQQASSWDDAPRQNQAPAWEDPPQQHYDQNNYQPHNDPIPFSDPRANQAGGGHWQAGGTGQQPQSQPSPISWQGNPWDLVGLSFWNFFLRIVTLGIYKFWAVTEVRKRIWSSVRVLGEPLAYTGTGKELFIGYLIVLALLIGGGVIIVFPIALILGALAAASPIVAGVVAAILYLTFYGLIFFLIAVAVYRARRYRLSRTLWRGIRGSMVGSPVSYAWLYTWTLALVPFTLGLIMPYRENLLTGRLNRETTFGTQQLTYEGSSKPLYGRFFALLGGGIVLAVFFYLAFIAIVGREFIDNSMAGVMTPLTLTQGILLFLLYLGAIVVWSIMGAWYQAYKLNLFASYTGLDRAKFSLRLTAGGLIGLILSNLFIVLFTLGILAPVAQARAARYFFTNLALDGYVDFDRIAQSQSPIGGGGEGLAQAFDVDAF